MHISGLREHLPVARVSAHLSSLLEFKVRQSPYLRHLKIYIPKSPAPPHLPPALDGYLVSAVEVPAWLLGSTAAPQSLKSDPTAGINQGM